jgi:hypothetical protein
MHPDDNAAAGYLMIGYRLGGPEPAGIWGSNLRVELSANFYFPDYSRTKDLPLPEFQGPPGLGVILGMYFSNDGMEGVAPLGADGFGVLARGAPSVKYSIDYDYIDFNLVVKTDHDLAENFLTFTPYVGLTVSILNQDFSLSTETDSNAVPFFLAAPYEYNVDGDLDTWYAGLLIGADLKFLIVNGLSFTIGGSIAPLYASTDMDLHFHGDYRLPGPIPPFKSSISTRVDDEYSDITCRATGKAEVNFRKAWLELSLTGSVEYWDYVPVVQYPTYNSGDWNYFVPASWSSAVPKIEDDHMLNFNTLFKVTIYFP